MTLGLNLRASGAHDPKFTGLFNLTNHMVQQAGKRYRIMTAIGRASVALANSIVDEDAKLELPHLIPLELHRYE